jgi:O-antigen/teichoic acid export membrane protein
MLALYGSAIRLVGFLNIPHIVIQAVIPPLISEAHALNEKKDLARGLQTLAALSFFPGFLVSMVYLYAGESILKWVFGAPYTDAATVLSILTIGYIVKLFVGSSQSLLMMTGHGKVTMTVSVTTGLILVVGCLLVGERYGMIGIAIVSVSSLILHSVTSFFLARIYVGIWVVPMLRFSQIKRYLSK